MVLGRVQIPTGPPLGLETVQPTPSNPRLAPSYGNGEPIADTHLREGRERWTALMQSRRGQGFYRFSLGGWLLGRDNSCRSCRDTIPTKCFCRFSTGNRRSCHFCMR